ncbi:MAG: hypothetical protein HQL69_20890, partial [Magnetococcales bacterium]|nr:hypothetical protein [Magnetococcales bacterium]
MKETTLDKLAGKNISVLLVGDVFGKSGRRDLVAYLRDVWDDDALLGVVANGGDAEGGV